MIGQATVLIEALNAMGLIALLRIYFIIKKEIRESLIDNKEKLDRLEVRVTSVEKTTITKTDFKELLDLHLKPINLHLENIFKTLGQIAKTKIKG